MRTTPDDRLAHAGRLVLLAGAALAFATLGVWTLDRPWVEDYGAALVDTRVAEARDRDVRLQALPRGDSEAIVALAQEQAAALAWVRPGERLEVERRRALEFLTRHRERLGDTAGATAAAREWAEFDPRNVSAVLEFGRLLALDPDGRAEAVEVLGGLFDRLPGVYPVAEAWCTLLMDEGRFVDAAHAALVCDRQARPNLWRVKWKRRLEAPAPFQAVVVPRLDADGNLIVECTIDGSALWVSFDLPPGGWCTLVDPVLTIERRRGSEQIALADSEDLGLVQLQRSGRDFTQTGGLGSRFELALGGMARDAKPTLRLQAKLVRPPSAGLLAIAHHARLADAAKALEQAGESEALEILRRARVVGLAQGQAQLYWRKRKGGFSKANSSLVLLGGELEGDVLRFDCTLPVGERASGVRLDFPEGMGVHYLLRGLEVVLEDGGSRAIDPALLEPEGVHGIDREGAGITVTGPDPWLAFELPGPAAKIARLHVWGEAR